MDCCGGKYKTYSYKKNYDKVNFNRKLYTFQNIVWYNRK